MIRLRRLGLVAPKSAHPVPAFSHDALVMKQHQQDDDRQRHTQHPEKKTSSHVNTPPRRIADENTRCELRQRQRVKALIPR
jgi:hypothetical protein